jgi:hypothetical protein
MASSEERRAFLRKENLFPSTLNRWRKERDRCLANGLPLKKRGRKALGDEERMIREIANLEKKIRNLKERLVLARTTIRTQEKQIHAANREIPAEQDLLKLIMYTLKKIK